LLNKPDVIGYFSEVRPVLRNLQYSQKSHSFSSLSAFLRILYLYKDEKCGVSKRYHRPSCAGACPGEPACLAIEASESPPLDTNTHAITGLNQDYSVTTHFHLQNVTTCALVFSKNFPQFVKILNVYSTVQNAISMVELRMLILPMEGEERGH
jgi:hypothetical protein